MPKYEVTDNITGRKYQLEGDSPPTEQELTELFAQQAVPAILQNDSQVRQQINKITSSEIIPEPSVYQKYIRPVAEPVAAYTGMGLGAAAGAVGGPAGWMTAPLLAGAGYAGGKQLYRTVEELAGLSKPAPLPEQLVRTGKEIVSGTAQQMAGLIGGRLIGGKVIKDPMTGLETTEGGLINRTGQIYKIGRGLLAPKQIKAGQTLAAERTLAEPFAGNVKTAQKVEEEIPGMQLTYGQKSDFPLAVRGEAVSARKEAIGAVLFKKLEAGNQAALREYIKNKFPGQEGIDDVMNVLKPKIVELRQTQTLSQNAVDNMLSDMPNITSEGVQQGGKAVRAMLNQAKISTWKQAQELYKMVDDAPINNSTMLQALKDYEAAAIARGEAPAVVAPVSSIVKQLEKGSEIKQAFDSTIKQFTQEQFSNLSLVRGLRGQAYKIASSSPDYQLANNARQVGKIIDENMEFEVQKIGGNIMKDFRTAQDFYNKEYVGKFRLGTVGNILKPGKEAASRYAKTDSEVIGEFFRGDKKGLERIEDLTNALGKENTQEMIKDYAVYDLKNNVINKLTGDVIPEKLAKWVAKHNDILAKSGLAEDFSTLASAQKIADASTLAVTDFEKSISGKMLNTDVNHAIETAFAGKAGKNSGLIAKQLLDIVKGNKAAEDGLRGAFKDFLMQKVENAAKDVAGNAMLSSAKASKVMNQYGNAIRTLWRDEPEKVKALYVFQEGVNILARNKTSQFAGSQTSEYEAAMGMAEKLPFMGMKGVIARFLIRLQDHLGQAQINDIITRGRFDPNFADHMIRMAKTWDKTRNFESLKQITDKIANIIHFEPVPGGKGQALGKALGIVGTEKILNQEEAAK